MTYMKRLFLLALLCACATVVRAQEYNQSFNFTYAPQVNGPLGQDFTNSGISSWFVQWQTTGTINTCAFEVDSSNDGITWGSADVIASQNCKNAAGKGSASSSSTFTSKYVRINVTALLTNGSLNVTLKGYFGNSGGSGANPSGNNGDLQSKSGSTLAASHINDNGSVIATSEDTQLIGPNPSVDIRAYGARAVTISTTCTGSGTALTVGSSSFVNGDGISCVGGGASPVMSTPGAPTVTTGLTESMTQSDAPVAAGGTGSTTYNYKIFAVSRSGEVTAPSSVTTIANGPATLGKTSITLNSLSLSGNTLTYASASATGLVQNAMVHIAAGSNSNPLSGWFTVSAIDSSTQAHTNNVPAYAASPVTAASGTLVYFIGNQVTWSAVAGAFTYGICSDRGSPGTYHVIGYSYPTSTSGGDVITTFDDFGFAATPAPFWYLGDSQCTGSAINSLYTGTVSAGGGTTSLTVSPALTNSVSGASARLDAAPGILAAANAAKTNSAQVYIPTGTFTINSPLNLPSAIGVTECGNLTENATIFVSGSTTWAGACRQAAGTTQFATLSPPLVYAASYPGLMSTEGSGALSFKYIDFAGPNQALDLVIDGSSGPGFEFHGVNLRTGLDAGDTTGIALIIRGGLYFDIADYFLGGGPDQVVDKTWTPLVYVPIAFGPGGIGQIQMKHGTWNRRGVLAWAANSGFQWEIDGVARQGGITPQFMFQQTQSGVIGGRVSAINMYGDTESQAKIAVICNVSCGGFVPSVQLQLTNFTSSDGGGSPDNVTGNGGESFVTPQESGLNGASFHGLTFAPGTSGSLLASDNVAPSTAGLNLGSNSLPFGNLFLSGSLTFTTIAPIIWQSTEGSCTGAAATKDSLCIGGSTASGYAQPGIREAVGAGPFLRLPQSTTALEGAAAGFIAQSDGNGNLDKGTTAQSIAPNLSSWYLSIACGTQSNCTAINADAHSLVDATSNSTTTVTAPDGNFTGTDSFGRPVASVGETVWATTAGTGIGLYSYTTVVCPETTIASINSATSITLNTACTANATANAVLVWGHKDGTALAAAASSALASTPTATSMAVQFPSGKILVDKPFANGTVANTPIQLVGPGGSEISTELIITPDFNWAGCTGTGATGGGVCIGSTAGYIGNLLIWGTGLTSAANANCANGSGKVFLAGNSTATQIIGVNLLGICPGETGEGVELNALDENWDYGGAQNVMLNACVVSAMGTQMRSEDCLNSSFSGGIGTIINASASLQDFGTLYHACVIVNGTLSSHFTHFTVCNGTTYAVDVKSGGIWNSDTDTVGFDNGLGDAVFLESGSIAQMQRTQMKGTINFSGFLTDMGGNTVTLSGGSISLLNTERGVQVLYGTCTGTATSSATLGLYGAGENSATTCTSTTTTLGTLMPAAGNMLGLEVGATHAGVSASSGVVTVLKNGVATAITCTIGTGTSCNDTTHTVAYANGDNISIQFTTQASEVLAGVKAWLLTW